MTDVTDPARSVREPVLSPVDRVSEMLFGLFMALTFTGAAAVAEQGNAQIRTMFIAALGCNLAWGLVDAVMYLVRTVTDRGRKLTLIHAVRAARDAKAGCALIEQSLSKAAAGLLTAAEIEAIRGALATEFGVQVAYDGADLMKVDQIEAMIERANRRFGGVDVLVNNAGIQHVAPVESFAPERWDAVIALNLSAAFHAIRCALPSMKQRGWGRIVNIASAHGLVASIEKAAYVAAKHGIVGLTKVVALETARTGITCNAICPGWVLTPLVQKQIDVRAQQQGVSAEAAKVALLSEKQPSLEFVTTEQIGELARFLCSDAAQQVRGAAWTIDGGWTAQ